MNKNITLYPSNWLYNAGVIGFLELTYQHYKHSFKFNNDDSVSLDINLFMRNGQKLSPAFKLLVDYVTKNVNINNSLNMTYKKKYANYVKKEFPNNQNEGYKYIIAGGKWFFGSKSPYRNLIQKKEWEDFKFVELVEDSVKNLNQRDLVCSFCNNKNISLKWIKKGSSLEKRLTIFANPHTDELGSSMGKFPNSFWNNKSSILICPICVFLFIYHRIAFIDFNSSQIFVNSPNFQLTFNLNKFVKQFLGSGKQYEIRKLFGLSLIQWAIKERTLLGAWTMRNIEIIIKTKNEKQTIVDYYDLPFYITKILLDPEIANLINVIGEEKIFNLIINGKFSELEEANYFVLRTLLKLKNNEKNLDDDQVKKYIDNYNINRLVQISLNLPELYGKIMKILKTEVKYE